MTKCIDHEFPCQNLNHDEFDEIVNSELVNPIYAHELVSESEFCMAIPVDKEFIIGDLDHKLYLKTLNGQSGLYHLWVDHENCDDHDSYTMSGVYVGKGPPDKRIADHIKSRWPNGVQLYATFTKMDNRLAKYYEQLFLDSYNFVLNKAENTGREKLHAVWDCERHDLGTHANEVSSMSKIQGFDDW